MRALTFTFASFVLACGGGSGGEGVPIDKLGDELAVVTCSKIFECCTAEEAMQQTLGSETEAECVRTLSLFGGLLENIYQDSIDAGRLVYHGDRLRDCFDLIAAQSCTQYALSTVGDGDFEAFGCEDPFDGMVAAGGQCASDEDCTSGYCSGDSLDSEGNIMYGTCATAPTAGMPCDSFTCASGHYCETGTCQPTKADGMPCTGADECTNGGCNADVCGMTMTCDGQ